MIIGGNDRTLSGTLREVGYQTSLVGKWRIGLGAGSIDWNGSIRPNLTGSKTLQPYAAEIVSL